MKNIITILIIFCFLISTALFANNVLKIGAYENPPKIYTDSRGEICGFWADITKEIARKENWQIEWVPGTWDQCLNRLENDEIDIMIDVGYSPERDKKFLFSKESVLFSWTRLYTRYGIVLNSLLDLRGMKIAGLAHSINLNAPEGLKDIVNRFEIECEIIEMESYQKVFKALENSEVDVAITNKDFGQFYEKKFNIKRTPIILQPIKVLFAVNKNSTSNHSLLGKIDIHIKQMKDDNGSLFYSSMEEHLGNRTSINIIPKWLFWILLIIIILLISAFFLIRTLRKLVAAKTIELKKDIENRKLVEEKLTDSNLLFETVLNAIPDVIGIQDANHKIIRYNEAGYKMLGKKHEEVAGVECYKLIGRKIPCDICATKEVYETKKPAHVERYEETINTWLDVRSYPVLDEKGEIQIVIEHLRDISQQKMLDKSLEESAQKLKLMIDQSPIGVSTTNLKGEYLSINPAYCKMVGYSEEELFGMTFSDITHPEDKEKNKELFEKLVTDNLKSYDLEKRYVKKNGEIIYSLIRSNIVRDNNGKPLFEIAICEDITKQKEVMNELLHSEARMKAIFEDSLDVIAVIDLQKGNIIDINKTVEDILGYKQKDIIGKPFSTLFPSETQKTRKEVLENLKVSGAIFRSQDFKRKDDSICIMDLSISKIPWSGSDAALVNLRDATERTKTEKIIQKDLKEKEVMLMEIHHRVKNNLQIISSMLKMQSVYIKDPEALSYFKDSQNRVKSMSLIHESLYQSEDLSKIGLQQYIKKLTNQLIISFNDLKKDIKIGLDIDDISLNINKTIPLGLLINEIVSNAYKHAFEGRDKGNISISLKKDHESYTLKVSDDGSSIPEDFDIENSNSLGLHLVNALISQLYGKLELERNHGTTFIVKFNIKAK